MSEAQLYVSLYRRWRPQRFQDVVGQDDVVRTLRNAVVAGELAHAYLFAGERGIGKTTIARILARAANCLAPQAGEPCNACPNCKTILSNRSLDILEIDGASNRGIDHIRRLRQEVAFAPTDLRTKVYIIDEVHMLTNEAWNALLKTLEEPPTHVVFVFATTEPHKVPRTILSRCQAFDFRRIPEEKIAARLAEIAQAETIRISEDALRLIARKANGGMRDAIVMIEQAASYKQGEINAPELLDMLGLVGRDACESFLRALEAGDRRAVLATVGDLVERGKDLEAFLLDLVEMLRDRIIDGGDVAGDVRLCRGLLTLRQDLLRSLDRRIVMEVALLDLLEGVAAPTKEPAGAKEEERPPAPRRETPPPVVKKEEPPRTETTRKEAPAPARPRAEVTGDLAVPWSSMVAEIEKERIAIAAFLTEASPALDGKRLHIAFPPGCTFHKESLEKPANAQYLAGAVRRHFGDEVQVEIRSDSSVAPKPTARDALREKAELVCELFDGKIVKEE